MKGQDFTRIVANELAKQPHINSAVSDILEGLTKGQLAGYSLETYGHMRPNNLNYWDSLFAIESEVIAHMFEALGSSGVRLQAMHEHFPTSWDMFLKYIKRF